jgi:hypothetical protein
VQESVEVPELTGPTTRLVDDSVQERFVELVLTERVTVPMKLLTGDAVIVDVPATPTVTVAIVGFAVSEKSGAPVTW